MQQTILFKVPGKPSTSPLVILTGPAPGPRCSTPVSVRLSRTLSKWMQRTRCKCTPRRIFRAMFSARTTAIVAAAGLAVMLWHNISIADTLEAQEALGIDMCAMLPWGIVWMCRLNRIISEEEGEL